MSNWMQKLVAALACLLVLGTVVLLQLPDAVDRDKALLAQWKFDKANFDGKAIADGQKKLPLAVQGKLQFISAPLSCLELKGNESLTIQAKQSGEDPNLPRAALSISSWVRIDQGEKFGGILGLVQHNGDYQKGFLLGYDESRFYFAVAGSGNSTTKLTYLKAKAPYEIGKWSHVVGTYDGKTMRIYVNGKEEATSTDQSGAIAYAPNAPFVVGKYKDDNEDYPMRGALAELELHKRVQEPKEIVEQFERNKQWTQLPAPPQIPRFIVEPYLQFPTRESIVIMWETSTPSDSKVLFGPNDAKLETVAINEKSLMHEVTLKELKPNTKYVYRVVSEDAESVRLESELRQFMSAVDEDSAFSFGVIGDTQKNPKTTAQIAKLIYERRPNFVVHCGDVVDNGPDKKEWVDELFKPCAALFSRVPVFPCIGNHEKNHANYYKYFSLPAPEYYYRYTYGNADFFVLDTNKSVKPDSEQYKWLDEQLGKSKAKWKFVYHHHPVWSSDDDDYGITAKGYYRLGDANARNLMTLYEKHRVDICFNGHIHLYERSWPVRDGKVDREKGTIYITSGGGGGTLENFAPLPNWFKAQCRVDYHYCLFNIQGGRLEMKAFDQNSNLFDFLDLMK